MKSYARVVMLTLVGGALAGCATVNFAPPALGKASVDAKDKRDSIADVRAIVSARKSDYDVAADQLANGVQAFDLPLIGLGVRGVNAAVFGNRTKVAKNAAVWATGILSVRTYYDPKERHKALLGASSALACIRRTADSIVIVDGQMEAWKKVSALSAADLGDGDVAKALRRLAPIARNAHMTLLASVDDVDTIARKQLFTATAPDLSTFAQTYQKQYITLTQQVQQNEAAAESVAKSRKAGARGADLLPDQAKTYAYLVEDTVFTNALSGLDASLTACRVLAGGT